MKIERINENQIRCTLTSFDLSVRNLNLSELAYGSEKARNLFREMIQKASNEVGFEAEDIPLMVEAIPLSNESVVLVITKIEDPDELDTRFSRFSPLSDDEHGDLGSLASEQLEGADDLISFLEPKASETEHTESSPSKPVFDKPEESKEKAVPLTRIFMFHGIDQVSEAATTVGHVFHGFNTLYKNPGTYDYYLTISNAGADALEYSRICNVLAEYGKKVRQEIGTEAYFREHYETIIKGDALQRLANL